MGKPIIAHGDESYFCLYLTENEHSIVAEYIREWCSKNSLTMKYYRKLKEGHCACYREVKVVGKGAAHKVSNYLQESNLYDCVEVNPWIEHRRIYG